MAKRWCRLPGVRAGRNRSERDRCMTRHIVSGRVIFVVRVGVVGGGRGSPPTLPSGFKIFPPRVSFSFDVAAAGGGGSRSPPPPKRKSRERRASVATPVAVRRGRQRPGRIRDRVATTASAAAGRGRRESRPSVAVGAVRPEARGGRRGIEVRPPRRC
jgi:hypothetical protein